MDNSSVQSLLIFQQGEDDKICDSKNNVKENENKKDIISNEKPPVDDYHYNDINFII